MKGHLRYQVTSTVGPPPPSLIWAHSLQGEGEVILAGLAVAYQVAGLLAQPQQRLCVRPADGPMVPAEGWRGTRCARQKRHPRKDPALGQQQCSTAGTSPGTAATV